MKKLRKETWHGVVAILLFVMAALFTLAFFNVAGIAGEKIRGFFSQLLGAGYLLLPISMGFLGFSLLQQNERPFGWRDGVSAVLFFFSGLGLCELLFQSGGLVGKMIEQPLVYAFQGAFSFILLVGTIAIGTIILLDIPLANYIKNFAFPSLSLPKVPKRKAKKKKLAVVDHTDESQESDTETEAIKPVLKEEKSTKQPSAKKRKVKEEVVAPDELDESVIASTPIKTSLAPYKRPPLSILSKDKGRAEVGDVKERANLIKQTLQNFGIDVEMDEVSIGPSVTRYALKPAQGVKLSRIENLQKDLSLALAAPSIRIEAPIPGKSLVGIEIPNQSKSMLGAGSLFTANEFKNSDKPLLVGLGKGISGKSYFANIAKMPHLLVAGATGSGKSVTVNNLIVSLLYRNSPQELKLIMIDPKRVELTLYNGIPHLLTPVIKDAKKAILALKWAIKEMERRYDVLEGHKVRDIGSYHENILATAVAEAEKTGDDSDLPESMPYIVIFIDELSDLMQAYPRELEAGIVRLAQMSRAVGIHLVLSTQRPSVNVITGLIKANVPARIALQVSSQIDSRTIIDTAGAEKLLGQGDSLYAGGEMSKPTRIQCAYISEDEVKEVVKFLIKQHAGELPDEIDLDATAQDTSDAMFAAVVDGGGSGSSDDDDDLYEEARAVVTEAGKASTSYLQRRLRVGYSRAARIIDLLEERGVIGQADGSKPRQILSQGTEEPMDSLVEGSEISEDDESLL